MTRDCTIDSLREGPGCVAVHICDQVQQLSQGKVIEESRG